MDTPVYYETLAAWGWEECTLCLMPERPGGHHSHPFRMISEEDRLRRLKSELRWGLSFTTPKAHYTLKGLTDS